MWGCKTLNLVIRKRILKDTDTNLTKDIDALPKSVGETYQRGCNYTHLTMRHRVWEIDKVQQKSIFAQSEIHRARDGVKPNLGPRARNGGEAA